MQPTREQFAAAKEAAKSAGSTTARQLVALGFLTQRQLVEYLAETFNTPTVDLEELQVEPHVVRLLDEDVVRRHCILPINLVQEVVVLAVSEPSALVPEVADALAKRGLRIELVFATIDDVEAAIDRHCNQTN